MVALKAMNPMDEDSARSVSLRIARKHLDAIDRYCVRTEKPNRTYFMATAAVAQAQKILQGEIPWYMQNGVDEEEGEYSTISIFLQGNEEEIINEACAATNHKLSLFIIWASVATVAEGNRKRRKKKRRSKK